MTEEEHPVTIPVTQTVDYFSTLEEVFNLYGYANKDAFFAADLDVQHFIYKLAAHRFASVAIKIAREYSYQESCILYDKQGFAFLDKQSITEAKKPELK